MRVGRRLGGGGRAVLTMRPRAMGGATDAAASGASALDFIVGSGVLVAIGQAGVCVCERERKSERVAVSSLPQATRINRY